MDDDSGAKPRVAILGLSLELYEHALPEAVARFADQFDRFASKIGTVASVVSGRLCFRREDIGRFVAQAEKEGVDALVVLPVSYTTSGTSRGPLTGTHLPVVIWNTQEAESFGPALTYDDVLMNHVTQGTQDLTSVLCRARRVFGMESGHFADATALTRLGDWLAAARTLTWARTCRVGILGRPFQDMDDFDVDEPLMASRGGPQTVHLEVEELAALLQQVDEADVAARVAEDARKYDVAPEVTPELHRTSAAIECALRRLVEEHCLDAFTMGFLDLVEDERCPTLPFLGINKLMGEGLGYAGEGDRMTAAHMAQAFRLCGAANFTEMFTIDYAADRVLMMHMQECNPALARSDRKVRLVRKDFWAPGVEPYVGMVFTLEPGPVTLTAVVPDGNGAFVYLAYETRIEDMVPLPEIDVPHWVVQLDEPVGDFLTRYSLAGGPHHLVSIPGHQSERLRKLAHLQGFGFRAL